MGILLLVWAREFICNCRGGIRNRFLFLPRSLLCTEVCNAWLDLRLLFQPAADRHRAIDWYQIILLGDKGVEQLAKSPIHPRHDQLPAVLSDPHDVCIII